MLQINQFEQLISKSESSILDFKKEFYDFNNNQIGSAKLIKDVISFCNTIRNETSYIIFGIKELSDNSLDLVGINDTIDDAILQEKVRKKIFPSAIFQYYTIIYQDKLFGVLEFPITKYDTPLSPTEKMKGLEPGKYYFRNGSSNTEASGVESIRINKWLESLPNFKNSAELNLTTSSLIIRLSNEEEKLSKILPELLALAKENNWQDIIEFCVLQIKGIQVKTDKKYHYRIQKVYSSIYEAKFNSNPYVSITQNKLRDQLSEDENFQPIRITFSQSVLILEQTIRQFEENSGFSITIQKRNAKEISDKNPDKPFYIYCLEDDYKSVYSNIRQKAIDYLIEK